jgi:hypothetical protein
MNYRDDRSRSPTKCWIIGRRRKKRTPAMASLMRSQRPTSNRLVAMSLAVLSKAIQADKVGHWAAKTGWLKTSSPIFMTRGARAAKQRSSTWPNNDPAGFVRAAVTLMPKDVLVDARGAGLVVIKLTDEDLAL